jgi:hypothetical protein
MPVSVISSILFLEKHFDMKRLKKFLVWSFIILLLTFSGLIIFSPYGNHDGFSYKLIVNTVAINAPVDSVFRFLGNSNNARKWSVFVDHITPLNTDSFPDGKPGSRRRCFCNADESGTRWDEVVTENVLNKKRQICCYALVDFSMSASNLATEQIYEATGNDKCKLTFTLFFKGAPPSLWGSIKTYIAAYKIKSIFSANMDNIRRISETGK